MDYMVLRDKISACHKEQEKRDEVIHTTTSTGIVVYNNPNTGGSTVGSADAVAATPTATTETQTGIDQANAAIQGVADTFEGLTGQSISSVESAQNIIDNPTQFLTPETSNSSIDTSIDGSAGLMDSSNPAYSLGGVLVDLILVQQQGQPNS